MFWYTARLQYYHVNMCYALASQADHCRAGGAKHKRDELRCKCLCRRVMHLPIGFAPVPIVHNFEGRTPTQVPGCAQSVLPQHNVQYQDHALLHTQPISNAHHCQCSHAQLVCSDSMQNADRPLRACRDLEHRATAGCACPGWAIQLQDPQLCRISPDAEPKSHVRTHHSLFMTLQSPVLLPDRHSCEQ